MVALHFLLPWRHIVLWPLTLLGVLPILLGCVLNVWADQQLKRAETTVKPFEKPSSLITDGAFRVSRHPMYVGMTAILIGIAVCLGTLTPMFVIPLFVAAMAVIFIPFEERTMAGQFGEHYREYCLRARRWL